MFEDFSRSQAVTYKVIRLLQAFSSAIFSDVRYMLSPVRLSSVCNARGKFYGDLPGEPLRRGKLKTRGVAKYSDFGPIEGYISETVQDKR